MRTRTLAIMAIGLALTLTGCSGSPESAGTTTGGDDPIANQAEGFEGTLATSGTYAATWKASQDAEPDVFNAYGAVTLTSDHQTFGNISVKPDGTVSFGSGAPELAPNLSFAGTGATVTLDETGQFVCAFSVDTDLSGSRDGRPLHLKGAMKVHWHPQGIITSIARERRVDSPGASCRNPRCPGRICWKQ
jgi:hypothetical protein